MRLVSGAWIGVWIAAALAQGACADEPWPLLVREDFQQGAARWEPSDPQVWRLESAGENRFYSQFTNQTNYSPPVRSPLHLSLLKDVNVSDFQLTVRVKSTIADYGHRDCCICFGRQSVSRFYYVHLGKQADDHANQVFIVNDQPRTKISQTSTSGTPWDDNWHQVRVVRRASAGGIEVYFDDFQKPVMTAQDTTFSWGQVGLGTFDDTSAWDDFELRGVRVERPADDRDKAVKKGK